MKKDILFLNKNKKEANIAKTIDIVNFGDKTQNGLL